MFLTPYFLLELIIANNQIYLITFDSQIYEELAEKDKERYHNEKKLQQMLPRDMDDEGDRKPRKKRLKKDPTAPKRNSSAYIFYSNEKRHELKRNNPELSFSDIAKILSKQWKNASAEDRRVSSSLRVCCYLTRYR